MTRVKPGFIEGGGGGRIGRETYSSHRGRGSRSPVNRRKTTGEMSEQ